MSASDGQSIMQLFDTGAAIRHLEQSISAGKEWYLALLEAIALWDCAEETRHCQLPRARLGVLKRARESSERRSVSGNTASCDGDW